MTTEDELSLEPDMLDYLQELSYYSIRMMIDSAMRRVYNPEQAPHPYEEGTSIPWHIEIRQVANDEFLVERVRFYHTTK